MSIDPIRLLDSRQLTDSNLIIDVTACATIRPASVTLVLTCTAPLHVHPLGFRDSGVDFQLQPDESRAAALSLPSLAASQLIAGPAIPYASDSH